MGSRAFQKYCKKLSVFLEALRDGEPAPGLLPFETLREIVGFTDYDAEQARYRVE